jgi:hypothetical protein
MRPLRGPGALTFIAVASLWLSASAARAATITLVVTPQSAPGANVDVALRIADLVDAAAPSLGTFDLDVAYDPTVLGSPSVVFGDPVLGDQLDLFALGALGPTATPGFGSINLFELSLDSVADLNSLQAGAFTLATLTFAPLSFGTSFLNVIVNVLGDAVGDPLSATVIPSTVTVDVSATAVPEPATLMLVGGGVGAYLARRRGRAR